MLLLACIGAGAIVASSVAALAFALVFVHAPTASVCVFTSVVVPALLEVGVPARVGVTDFPASVFFFSMLLLLVVFLFCFLYCCC